VSQIPSENDWKGYLAEHGYHEIHFDGTTDFMSRMNMPDGCGANNIRPYAVISSP
jgi:hypothetical protein